MTHEQPRDIGEYREGNEIDQAINKMALYIIESQSSIRSDAKNALDEEHINTWFRRSAEDVLRLDLSMVDIIVDATQRVYERLEDQGLVEEDELLEMPPGVGVYYDELPPEVILLYQDPETQ